MSQDSDYKMGVSYLDDVENDFNEFFDSMGLCGEPINLLAEYGGPFQGDVQDFIDVKTRMCKNLERAEKKLKNYDEALARLYYLKGWYENLLSGDDNDKRGINAINYFTKAIDLNYSDLTALYYDMALTHDRFNGKKEDAIHSYEKVIEVAGMDSEMGMQCAKNIEELKEHIERQSERKGCFIATAVYGSPLAPEVVILRQFRDEVLLQSIAGKMFISIYYFISPQIAHLASKSITLKTILLKCLLEPIIVILRKKLITKTAR